MLLYLSFNTLTIKHIRFERKKYLCKQQIVYLVQYGDWQQMKDMQCVTYLMSRKWPERHTTTISYLEIFITSQIVWLEGQNFSYFLDCVFVFLKRLFSYCFECNLWKFRVLCRKFSCRLGGVFCLMKNTSIITRKEK